MCQDALFPIRQGAILLGKDLIQASNLCLTPTHAIRIYLQVPWRSGAFDIRASEDTPETQNDRKDGELFKYGSKLSALAASRLQVMAWEVHQCFGCSADDGAESVCLLVAHVPPQHYDALVQAFLLLHCMF